MAPEVTLKNGVWVHEVEWAAIQRLINTVEAILQERTWAAPPTQLADAYWCWRNVEMDIEEGSRAIRQLTNIIGELTSADGDVSISSVL